MFINAIDFTQLVYSLLFLNIDHAFPGKTKSSFKYYNKENKN